MAVGISINIEAVTKLKRNIARLAPPSLAVIQEKARQAVVAANSRQFATEGAAGGTPWARLTASTVRDRLRQGFGAGPILLRTGALRGAATTDLVVKVENAGKTLAFNVRSRKLGRIAAFHQSGTSRMPARPIFVVTPQLKRELVEIYQQAAIRDIRGQLAAD